jgi:hypothetical protein
MGITVRGTASRKVAHNTFYDWKSCSGTLVLLSIPQSCSVFICRDGQQALVSVFTGRDTKCQ